MSVEKVRAYLSRWNRQNDIIELELSTATVPQAAAALGVPPGRIAKSIGLKNLKNKNGEGALVVLTAGDAKLDNKKFKEAFGFKARMLTPEEALAATGHPVGGVCPFALPEGVPVCLDVSLRQWPTVYPACGSGNSAIKLTLEELAEYAQSQRWVDVCRAGAETGEEAPI